MEEGVFEQGVSDDDHSCPGHRHCLGFGDEGLPAGDMGGLSEEI